MSQRRIKEDLYDKAAAIIQKVQSKERSLKSLVYESNSENIRQLYALICESLKYGSIIDRIIETTAFLDKVPWMDRNLALVLLYDFLFGKKLAGSCSGKYRKAVVKQRRELKAELQRMMDEKGVAVSRDLLPKQFKDEIAIPRYARVNLLKTSVDGVTSYYVKEGYTCVMTREEAALERTNQSAQYISCLSVDIANSLVDREFAVDLHLDDVLVFPAGTDFHSHPLYLQGSIILMDKASCIPVHLLSASPGAHVIDACSAPGNKTSHMASLLRNEGKIFSFDLDTKRIRVMNTLLERAGVTVAETIHQDFLTSDPSSPEYSKVDCIIVDPSCSGSGMTNRKDYLVDKSMEGDPVRLRSLHQLQRRILEHALSFPSVRRVVYSTCSIHREENEDVVGTVLKRRDDFRLVPALQDTWAHRGLPMGECRGQDIGTMCLRASPTQDLTNGFFVALFERVGTVDAISPKLSHAESAQSPSDVQDGNANERQKEEERKEKKLKRSIDAAISTIRNNACDGIDKARAKKNVKCKKKRRADSERK